MLPGFSWASIAGLDKLGHLVFYCILALWVIYGFFRLPQRYRCMPLWTFLLCAGFGVGMEILQGVMRMGRQFEYLDMLANVAGVLIAIGLFWFLLNKKYHGSQ